MSPLSRSGRGRRRLFAVGTVLVALVATCIVLESALRALNLVALEVLLDEPHPLYGWRHIPGAVAETKVFGRSVRVEMNSKGLRDREIAYAKAPRTYRILLLGDSFVEGRQVPLLETFAKRLEMLLNDRATNRQYEVVNAGVGGFGTDNELLFYREEASKYAADLVILTFFAGNDLYDNSAELLPVGTPGKPTKPWFILQDGKLSIRDYPCACDPSVETGGVARAKRFLRQHSASYVFLRNSMIRLAPEVADVLVRAGAMKSLYRQQSHLTPNGIPLTYAPFSADDDPPAVRRAWDLTARLITELAAEVDRDRAALVVMEIPVREQIHDDLWQQALGKYPAMQAKRWDLDKPDRLLQEVLRRSGIRFLAVTDALRKHSRTRAGRLYFDSATEHHLTTAGHSLIAELLLSFLTTHALLESSVVQN